MILLIHGENIVQSRKYFLDIKNSSKNIISLDGTNLKISDLLQIIQGEGLFEEQNNIFIENLLLQKKHNKEGDTLISYLSENGNNRKIVLWESKSLNPTQLKMFKNSEIKKFDFPKIIFNFLETIKPNNFTQSLSLFHETLATQEAELIFFMLVRHFRILISLAEETDEVIDEVKRLTTWQKNKINSQITVFGKKKLLEIYNALFEIEKGIKTGLLPIKLIQAIDFLLISI